MLLNELNHVAGLSAFLTTPYSCGGGYPEIIFALVIMERTSANEIAGCILGKFNAPTAHQRDQIGLAPDVFHVRFRYSPAHKTQFLVYYSVTFPANGGSVINRIINLGPATYHISVALLYIGEIYGIRVSSILDWPRATAGFAPYLLARPPDFDSQIWLSSGVDSPVC